MHDLQGEYRLPPAKETVPMSRGDVINNVTQNGGGYGDPLEREPALVAANVHEGSSDRAVARDVYGVIVTEDGGYDAAATEARRDELARTLTLDQGKPISEAHDEVEELVLYWRNAAEDGKRLEGRLPNSMSPGKKILLFRRPRPEPQNHLVGARSHRAADIHAEAPGELEEAQQVLEGLCLAGPMHQEPDRLELCHGRLHASPSRMPQVV